VNPSQLHRRHITSFRRPFPRFMVDFEHLDLDNHLQLMVGLYRKNIFLYKRMIKENRSQGGGGKQGEINLTLKITHF
jgi:hypothetical protein